MKKDKIADDPWIKPHLDQLNRRAEHIKCLENRLLGTDVSDLKTFANAHEYFGLHFCNGKWIFREWAPNATAIFLIGDFSGWTQHDAYALNYGDNPGVWEIELPEETLTHGDLYKLHIYWPGGAGERIPAYTRRVVQDPKTHIFSAQVWNPPKPYTWKHKYSNAPRTPLIYESHIGMAQEEPKVGSYTEYREKILPRIIAAGYNTIQLMGILEHPYYGSFGYHVSNFFAISSRFGTPEEFKELVDACHEAGIAVIIDLIHSHAVKNEQEGLSRFDGTLYQYFHSGPRGYHEAWDSRCFDYGKSEVLHFLLSNARYWIDEFNIDGFRFDGVTSMLYHHRGLGVSFTSLDDYFDGSVDLDALAYLSLVNKLLHSIRPNIITIAEDVSGMPGLCSPKDEGGCGFDYRLAMGIPDTWFKLVNDTPDEAWNLGWLFHELTTHRPEEKTISYAESHDQALVGGKTLIFELIDAAIYDSMRNDQHNLVVDRGIALHKIIRLITAGTAQYAYLNFMGNEFGHPEWIDFPREGNNWSYEHARRLWPLRDDPNLKFHALADFDQALINLIRENKILNSSPVELRHIHEDNKILVFEHHNHLFCINLHPTQSFTDYPIDLSQPATYKLVLNTDEERFGGFNEIKPDQTYSTQINNEKNNQLFIYLPARTAIVLQHISTSS